MDENGYWKVEKGKLVRFYQLPIGLMLFLGILFTESHDSSFGLRSESTTHYLDILSKNTRRRHLDVLQPISPGQQDL